MQRQITTEAIVQAGLDSLKATLYLRMPGAVVSYNADDEPGPTADVQPMIQDVRFDLDTGQIVYEPWAIIRGVPVAWPKFGGFMIKGNLEPNDPVILEAFDLDPNPWRAQGRSTRTVPPDDVRRLGGNYWSALPVDLIGPFTDAGAAGMTIMGIDGDPAQVRFSPGSIQLGRTGGDHVALASIIDAFINVFLTTWVVTPNDGGLALKTALTMWALGPPTYSTVGSALIKGQ